MRQETEEQRATRLEYHRRYHAANREVLLARRRLRREREAETLLVEQARHRAKRSDLLFDITPSDISIPETCPVLGIPLSRAAGRKSYNEGTAASLDRLDPALGYVRGNVAVISWRANRLKSDASADELERIAAWMRSQEVRSK